MIAYMHFKLGKGRVTAAIEVEGQTASVGLAFCSPKDQFERRRGRLIAGGRLKAGVVFMVWIPPDQRLKKQIYKVLLPAFTHKFADVPSWVRYGAKIELEKQ